MKKFISIGILFLMIISMTACSASQPQGTPEEMAARQERIEQLSMFSESLIASIDSLDEEGINSYLEMKDDFLDFTLKASTMPCEGTAFKEVLRSWQSSEKDFGEFVSKGEFEVTEKGDEITLSCPAKFADRDVDMSFNYDEFGYLKSLDINGHYSSGEIATKAGLNTLLGMGTVFSVLILISFVIYLLGRLTGGVQKKEKPAQEAAAKQTPVAAAPAAAETKAAAPAAGSDEELVAVISAAIAAATGQSTDGFIVRSIKRRSHRS